MDESPNPPPDKPEKGPSEKITPLEQEAGKDGIVVPPPPDASLEPEKPAPDAVPEVPAEGEDVETVIQLSDADKRNFSAAETNWPRLEVRTLDEVHNSRTPTLQLEQLLTATGSIFVIEAIDERLALGLAVSAPQKTKFHLSLDIAEGGLRDPRLKHDLRGALRILEATIKPQRAKFTGSLLVVDPGERGRGKHFWQKLRDDAETITAFLDEHAVTMAVLSLGTVKPYAGAAFAPAVPVEKADSFPLIAGLCAEKQILAGDDRLEHARKLCADDMVAAALVAALSMDDYGEVFFDEVDNVTQTEELRSDADAKIKTFFLARKYECSAAIFVASYFPDCPFSDFDLLVSEVISAKSFHREGDDGAAALDDMALDEAGLRRGRMIDGERRPKTVVRFQRGRGFPAVMRSFIEARAMVFLKRAVDRLGERMVLGEIGPGTALRLTEEAAAHIAAYQDHDLDGSGKQVALWLAGRRAPQWASDNDGPNLRKRSSALADRFHLLLPAAFAGLARGLRATPSDAATALACGMLSLPNAPHDLALLRMKAYAAYYGLISGAAPQRLVALIHVLDAAPEVCKWLALGLVGNNWGLANSIARPSQAALDRLIQACAQVVSDNASPSRIEFAERLLWRALAARIQGDGVRLDDLSGPEIDASTISCLLKLAAATTSIAEPFLKREIAAAAAFETLSEAELQDVLGPHELPPILADAPPSARAHLVGAESVFALQCSLLSGLTGIGQEDGDAFYQASSGFARALQQRHAGSVANVDGPFSTTFLWLKDFTASKSPQGLRHFSQAMNSLRAITPILCCALACSQKFEDVEGQEAGGIRIVPNVKLDTAFLDRKSQQELTDNVKFAIEVGDRIQDAWLRGVKELPPGEARQRYTGVPRFRRNMLRSFFQALRSAR